MCKYFLDLLTSSGSGQGTLRGGLTAIGAERSSNGDRVPGDAALVSPLRWTDDLVKVAGSR
jgi:hypothetical protein